MFSHQVFQCTGPLKSALMWNVSLRDGSVLFHRQVALEWNVLRPECFLHLGVIRYSSWGSCVVIMAILDIDNTIGKIRGEIKFSCTNDIVNWKPN